MADEQLRRIVAAVHDRGDGPAWLALARLVRTAARLGTTDPPPPQDLLRAALATERRAGRFFAEMVRALRDSPELVRRLEGPGEDIPLALLTEAFDVEAYDAALDATLPDLLAIVAVEQIRLRQARRKQEGALLAMDEGDGRPDKGAPTGQPSKGEADEGTSPATPSTAATGPAPTAAPSLGGITAAGAAATDEEDGGTSPRDTPPPEIFGEQSNGTKCAICIHAIQCRSPTTLSFLNDQIAWACDGYQLYTDFPYPIRVEFVSREHDDIDTGYVLSGLDANRNPTDEETTRITIREERLAARAYTRMAGKDGAVIGEYFGTFDLEKFIKLFFTFTLIESDSDEEELIGDFLELLTLLTGAGVVSAASVAPVVVLAGGLTGGSAGASQVPDAFRRLGEFLRKLVRERENQIGSDDFEITRSMIEAAFDAGSAIPSNEGFEYVIGPTKTFTGKGGNYTVELRYERYG